MIETSNFHWAARETKVKPRALLTSSAGCLKHSRCVAWRSAERPRAPSPPVWCGTRSRQEGVDSCARSPSFRRMVSGRKRKYGKQNAKKDFHLNRVPLFFARTIDISEQLCLVLLRDLKTNKEDMFGYIEQCFHSLEGCMPQVQRRKHGGVDGMEMLAHLFLCLMDGGIPCLWHNHHP